MIESSPDVSIDNNAEKAEMHITGVQSARNAVTKTAVEQQRILNLFRFIADMAAVAADETLLINSDAANCLQLIPEIRFLI